MKLLLTSWMLLLTATILLPISPITDHNDVFIDSESASGYPGFSFVGEYTGYMYLNGESEKVNVGLQTNAIGNNQFRAMLYYGGLPGERSRPVEERDKFELLGIYKEDILELEGEIPLKFRFVYDNIIVIDEENNYTGHLERIRRVSPTDGVEPPEGAIVLFDGTNLNHWDDNTEMTEDGLLKEGATTVKQFGDMRLHVEAKLPFIPDSQNRANSGIYIQNRYEVQILETFSFPATIGSNGSLYNVVAPRINVSYPPLTWQTYDVFFRAPRFDEEGNKSENARFTVYMNGILVHDEVELDGGTGAGGQREEVPKAELYLQDHGDPVFFRNVWLVEGEPSPPGGMLGW